MRGGDMVDLCRHVLSDRCLLIYNLALLNCIIGWTIYVHVKTEYDALFANDTPFEHAILATLDAYDYMEAQKTGRAIVTDLNIGPFDVHHVPCRQSTVMRGKKEGNGDWQNMAEEGDLEVHLYNAYIDRRPRQHICPSATSFVQVLAMVRRAMHGHLYCHMYDGEGEHMGSRRAFTREIWQRAWDPRNRFYLPLLITCPSTVLQPHTVSITRQPCGQPNNALIIRDSYGEGRRTEEDKVVVCVKGMDFLEDTSERLIEWFEWNRLMGVDKIVIYAYAVHWRTEKMFSYYTRDGILQVIPLTLPGHQPNNNSYTRSKFIWRNRQQKRRNELIPYNDCLYRHVGSHDWVLILDTDEIVVPIVHGDYAHMLDAILRGLTRDGKRPPNDVFTTLSTINVFKFDNLTTSSNVSIPQKMHMLRHSNRSKQASRPGDYGKSFMSTQTVATAFNHFALHKTRPRLQPTKYISTEMAVKLHYKQTCPIESRQMCPMYYREVEEDHSLDRFKDTLIARFNDAVRKIEGNERT